MREALLVQRRADGEKLAAPAPAQAAAAGATPAENRLLIFDRESRLRFLVDSGSVVSLLPRRAVNRRLARSRLTLHAANATDIATYGTHPLTLSLSLRRTFRWDFIVADVQTAILGADFLLHFGLLVDLRRGRLVDPQTSESTPGESHSTLIHSVAAVARANVPQGDLGARISRLLAEFAALATPTTAAALLEGASVHHRICTSGPPVFERPRRLCGERLAAAKRQFDTHLSRGVARPSSSEWASPLHMVPKHPAGWRTTGDYRRLNACTVPDRYPLPIIEDLLQGCHGCTVFSKIDLHRAYYQIPVAPEDVGKTAVTTPFGLFEFVGMPLGLRNASQTFQRFMDALMRPLPFVRCYLDDLLVASASPEQHLQHLRQLLTTLRQARLAINIGKCEFGKDKVEFLGFQLSAAGYEPPPRKVEAISNYTKPVTARELRRFLGMLNFYRSCIPRAAELQAPLHDMLRGFPRRSNKPVVWTPERDAAFEACKLSIVTAVRASFIAPSLPLVLSADASNNQIGGNLDQLVDGKHEPIGLFSRKLSDTEKRYSTYDRELLAIFAAVKHFQRILEGREFVIRTDHRPLIYAAHRQGVSEAAATARFYFAVPGHVRARSRGGERSCRRTVPRVHRRHANAADHRRPQRSAEGLPRAATSPGSSTADPATAEHRGQHSVLQHRQQHRQAVRPSRPAANGVRRGAWAVTPEQEVDGATPGAEILLAWHPEGRSALVA